MKILKFISMLLVFTFIGCSALRLPNLPTPKKAESVYRYRETAKITPRAVAMKDQIVVVEEIEKTITIGLEQTPAKKSFAQRIGGWISGLGIIGILALIAGLVLAPGATMAFLIKTVIKWKRAMRETVVAIKDAKTLDQDANLRNSLADKQSIETKKVVDTIKRTL